MMKRLRILFFAGALLNFPFASAQPVLTGANSNPVPGDGFILHSGHSTSQPFLIGNGGANQTWVISTIPSTIPSTRNFEAASTTPYFSSFPGSNVASSDGTGFYQYFIASSSEYTNLGNASASGANLYIDPEKIISFPFQFNDSFYDTFNDTNIAVGGVYYGNVSATADGYGTLNLPIGIFSNILRVHYILNFFSIDSLIADTIVEDGYYFYEPGFHQFIFAYLEAQFFHSGSVAFSYDYGYNEQTSVGLANPTDQRQAFSVFPNPVHDKLNLIFKNPESGLTKIRLADLSGNFVKEIDIKNSSPGEIKECLPMDELKPGIYFLDVITDEKHFIEKIIVE